MEQIVFQLNKPVNLKARKPNILLENIRTLLGPKTKKVNGEYVELDRLWTYKELGIYLGGVPKEWLQGFYSASVDAENPARHFMYLVKQSRLKVI